MGQFPRFVSANSAMSGRRSPKSIPGFTGHFAPSGRSITCRPESAWCFCRWDVEMSIYFNFNKIRISPEIDSRSIPGSSCPVGRAGTTIAIPTQQIIENWEIVPCSACGLLGRGLISEDFDASFTDSHAHGTSGELSFRSPRP